jgi:hypothetical protein
MLDETGKDLSKNSDPHTSEGDQKLAANKQSYAEKDIPVSNTERPNAEHKNNKIGAHKVEWATIIIALTAAIASSISALFTLESYSGVQRPFVSIKSLEAKQDLPLYWNFNVVFRNSGNTQTQGMNYTVDLNCDLAHGADPEELFRNPRPNSLPQHWYITLGPQTDTALPFGTEIGLPFSTIDRMAKERSFCSISGVVHYRDNFTLSSDHVTKFCYVIGAVARENSSTPTYSQCTYWNCADKDCDRDKERYQAALQALNPQLAK